MTSRRPEKERQANIRRLIANDGMAGAGVGLAVLFAGVMAVGIAIGYLSV